MLSLVGLLLLAVVVVVVVVAVGGAVLLILPLEELLGMKGFIVALRFAWYWGKIRSSIIACLEGLVNVGCWLELPFRCALCAPSDSSLLLSVFLSLFSCAC